jgi:hypothetical protein
MIKATAALLMTGMLAGAGPANAAPVKSAQAACSLIKVHYHRRYGFPLRRMAFCDIISRASSPAGLYVMALHSNRRCDGICSSNLGWFAVRKASEQVFEWDVGEQKLGPPFR